jgi:hypothetical protein
LDARAIRQSCHNVEARSERQPARHQSRRCQELIKQYNLDEEMSQLAARQGKYKRLPFRDQISAYELLRDSAYGKLAVIQIANVNETRFVKQSSAFRRRTI